MNRKYSTTKNILKDFRQLKHLLVVEILMSRRRKIGKVNEMEPLSTGTQKERHYGNRVLSEQAMLTEREEKQILS